MQVLKYQNGNSLIKEDSIRLRPLKSKFVGDFPESHFWNSFNFQKDDSDVSSFFKSYLSSKGIKRILNNQDKWWKSRHPYKKWYSNSNQGTKQWLNTAKKINPYIYKANMYADQSKTFTIPGIPQRVIVVGTRDSNFSYYFDDTQAIAHEYAHGVAPFTAFGPKQFDSKSAQAEALDQNTNTNSGHDSRREEKHADLWGLKYILYKEGIYDSRGEKDITEEEIQKLRDKYPNLRPLRQMDNKQLMFQLNNVASTWQELDKQA